MENLKIVPIKKVEILPIRYQSENFDTSGRREIDEYFDNGIYQFSNTPFHITEPRYDYDESFDKERNLGELNKQIALTALKGFNNESVVFMCGGNCSHTLGIVGAIQK